MNKINFEELDYVFGALCNAFPYNDEKDDTDPRFDVLWTTALYMAGWTEDEFWEAHEIEYSEESECPSCKAERENKCCSDCESCDGCCDDEEEEQPKLVKPTKVDKNLN